MPEQQIHPSAETLSAFSRGALSPDAASDVESHISECPPCCETLLGLASDDTFVAQLREANRDAAEQTIDQGSGPAPVCETDDVPIPLVEHSRYEIEALVGKGGMGDVFKARHRMMDRTVALKVINRDFVGNPEAAERFHREVQAAARLSHPNIVTAYDAEQADDLHFLVMEYVDGTDLSRVVREHGALSVEDACDYVRQAAIGLQHAHELGMVHRDIKPHNLMVTGNGTVKILDFGLAALSAGPYAEQREPRPERGELTTAGTIMGTPDFISPEQAKDAHRADVRSDVYSLGATLYYLLSGQAPFAEKSVPEKLTGHAELEPEPIEGVQVDVPVELARVIRRMMAKDPAERFQTPAEVAEALAPFSSRGSTTKPSTGQAKRPERSQRRPITLKRVAIGMISLLFAGILYVVTDTGTLIIDSDDENIEIAVRPLIHESHEGNRHSFAWQYRVGDTTTGSTVKRLRSGAYIVDLKGRENEFELSQDRFILKRGGEVVVKVTRRPAQPPPAEAPATPVSTRLREAYRFKGHQSWIGALDVSADGKYVATASGTPEQAIHIWDMRNGRLMRRLTGHNMDVHAVCFSPDGKRLATGGKRWQIVLWDFMNEKEVRRLEGLTCWTQSLAWSPDARRIASGSANWEAKDGKVEIRIWSADNGELIRTIPIPDVDDTKPKGEISFLQFLADGRHLLAHDHAGNTGIAVWDTETGELVRTVAEGDFASVALSPDARLLATGHPARERRDGLWDDVENAVIRLWDMESGEVVRVLRGHRSRVNSLCFTPDGKRLISASGADWINNRFVDGADHSIRMWDVETGRELLKQPMELPQRSICLSPDGRRLVSNAGRAKGQPDLRLWELPDVEAGAREGADP